MEATSVGTMWSVINALTTSIKIVNNSNGNIDDDTDHLDVGNYAWSEFYKRYTENQDQIQTTGLLSSSSTLVSVNKNKEKSKATSEGNITCTFLTLLVRSTRFSYTNVN